MTYIIYFDGACEPYNPGGYATYGWVIRCDDLRLVGNGLARFGEGATNNLAEYAGLESAILALQTHLGQGEKAENIIIRGDSALVVNQVAMQWKCKKEHLRAYRDRILKLLTEITEDWDIEWIPRERNAKADALSKSVANLPKLPPRRKRTTNSKSFKRRK